MDSCVESPSTSSAYRQTVQEVFKDLYQQGYQDSFIDAKAWVRFISQDVNVPVEHRCERNTLRALAVQVRHFNGKEKRCPWCWVFCSMCYCEKLEAIFRQEMDPPRCGLALTGKETTNPAPRVRFHILMHCEEFLRITNSAHVLGMLTDANLYIAHIPAHMQRLSDEITTRQAAGEAFCVLYPAKDAQVVDVKETDPQRGWLDAAFQRQNGQTIGMPSSGTEAVPTKDGIMNILLFDGTWNNTKNFNKRVPSDIPRIQFSLDFMSQYQSLFAPLRNRTRVSGVSTCEAAFLLMNTGGPVEHRLAKALRAAFVAFVDVIQTNLGGNHS